jgi:hypothetical protein
MMNRKDERKLGKTVEDFQNLIFSADNRECNRKSKLSYLKSFVNLK